MKQIAYPLDLQWYSDPFFDSISVGFPVLQRMLLCMAKTGFYMIESVIMGVFY